MRLNLGNAAPPQAIKRRDWFGSLTTLIVRSANPVLHLLVFHRLIEAAVLIIEMALRTLLRDRLLRLLGLGHRCLWRRCALPDRRRSTRLVIVSTPGQRCDRTCA